MEKIIKVVNIAVLFIASALSPFIFIGLLFGLSGSNPGPIYLIAFGYIGIIIFSFISLFKQKFFVIVIISIILVFIGYTIDKNFWKSTNENLCKELRANPTCVEDACGFDCTNYKGFGFSTLGSICPNWDSNSCTLSQAKRKQQEDFVISILGTSPFQYLQTKGIKPGPEMGKLIDKLEKIILDNSNKTPEEIRGLIDAQIGK